MAVARSPLRYLGFSCFVPQPDTCLHCQNMVYEVSISRSVPVYGPAFGGRLTHCAYPQRDGQAELTWVAGYKHADGHPSKY